MNCEHFLNKFAFQHQDLLANFILKILKCREIQFKLINFATRRFWSIKKGYLKQNIQMNTAALSVQLTLHAWYWKKRNIYFLIFHFLANQLPLSILLKELYILKDINNLGDEVLTCWITSILIFNYSYVLWLVTFWLKPWRYFFRCLTALSKRFLSKFAN